MILPILEGFIALAFGIFATLTGYGVLPAPKPNSVDEFARKRFRWFYRFGGPFLIFCGFGSLVAVFFRTV